MGSIYAYISMFVSVYTYVQVTTINKKSGHGFERQQAGVYERDWRKKREGL